MKILLILLVIQLCLIGAFAQSAADDPSLAEAETLNKKVVTLYSEGKYDEALIAAKRAAELFENKAGKDDLRTALALKNLAQVYYKLDEKKNAKKAFNDALNVYEKNVPLSVPNEKRYVELLETVALFEAGDADSEGAAAKLLKALELREKINGTESSEVAEILYSLAQIYRIQGKYEKALPLLKRSIDIKASKNDGDIPIEMLATATCMMNTVGEQEEAKELQNRFSSSSGTNEKTKKDGTVMYDGLVEGKARSLPAPRMTAAVRAMRIGGKVTVQTLIDEKGNVIFACAVSGPKELYETSEEAAYAAKFSPTIVGGKAVKVMGYIKYNYTF